MAQTSALTGKTLGHYRIQAQLGAGGMGVVYAAYDTVLQRKVAIKVVGDGVIADKSARDLLLNEARAASSLNHPNICTIHEVGDSDGEAYIVMEQVEGQPLSALLGIKGLPPDLVVRYGIQVADALSHAHEHGVIHRDLKSSNAIVTPAGRVKVLDFGLAARLGDGELEETISSKSPLAESGAIVGTLPYLAPELLQGQPAEARTDIWALGILLYEMATGNNPFGGRTAFELSSAILREPPTPLPESVPSSLRTVILHCLEKLPGERYQGASEVRVALEVSHDTRLVAPPAPYLTARWLLLSLPLLLILGLFVFNGKGLRDWLPQRKNKPAETLLVPGLKVRKSVAVLGFKNSSQRSEAEWLSTALSEMLGTELAAGEKLRVLPSEDIVRMERDLSLAEKDELTNDALARVHNYTASDFILAGSYTALGKASGGQLRLDVRLQDAITGQTIASIAEAGSEISLFDLVSRVGADLRHRMGIGDVSPVDAASVQASYPTTPEAARLYAKGLSKLRLMDSQEALKVLQEAVAEDPQFPLAHSALATAWAALGYDAKASDEAKTAFELSGNLSREERLLVEGQYRELTKQWPLAIDIYRTLFAFLPDNLEYGLRLAASESAGGKPDDTLRTLESLRKLPSPFGEDPRIDREQSQAFNVLGDFKQQLATATRTEQRAEAQGAKLLSASSRLSECYSLQALGASEKARQQCEKARQTFASVGDRNGEAIAIDFTALSFFGEGNFSKSKKLDQDALAIFRETGNRRRMGTVLTHLANVTWQEGDLDGALEGYSAALANYQEVGDRLNVAAAKDNLGSVHYLKGDLKVSQGLFQEALTSFREIGSKGSVANALENLAAPVSAQGDLEAARKMLEEAVAIDRAQGVKSEAAWGLAGLGDIDLAEGKLDDAARNYNEALSVRTAIGEKETIAETQLALANLELERGQTTDAEIRIREAREEFRNEKQIDNEMLADTVLARALVAQHKYTEAQKEVTAGKAVLAKSQNRPNQLQLEIAEAQLQAAENRIEEANRNLAVILAEAKKTGFFEDQLKARLVMGEIEMKTGKRASGGAHLGALEKDATSKGFVLIAREAAAERTER